jgi:hypothetical protein
VTGTHRCRQHVRSLTSGSDPQGDIRLTGAGGDTHTRRTMQAYDPLIQPDADAWSALPEERRINLVQAYHLASGVPTAKARGHAVFHVVVENQVALAQATPVVRALARLMAEGLDRHEAVHAVASVLAQHLNALMKSDTKPLSDNATYYARLERLSARTWRPRR